jgi:PAS domain S-box-containing protein
MILGERKTKIVRYYQWRAIFFILIVGACVIALHVFSSLNKFNSQAIRMRENYTEQQKQIVKQEVDQISYIINKRRAQLENKTKEIAKSKVDFAYSIASSIWNNNTYGNEEIKLQILSSLRAMCSVDEKQCFYVTQYDGTILLSSVNQQYYKTTEKIKLINKEDQNVFSEVLDLVKKSGEGFVEYLETNSDSDIKKILYVKSFEPFNFVFIAEISVEDVEEQTKIDLLSYISDTRFGKEGYVFVNKWNGNAIVANGVLYDGNTKIWELFNQYPDEVRGIFNKEYIVAQKLKGDFINYSFPKLNDTSIIAKKISFIQGISDWEWIVGAGVYIDEIDSDITNLHKELKKQIIKDVIFFVIIVLSVVILFLTFIHIVSKKLKSEIENFLVDFYRVSFSDIKIHRNNIHFYELDVIAENANKLLEKKMFAQQSVIEEKERLYVTLRSIGDGVIVTDKFGKIDMLNGVAEELTGWSSQDAKGREMSEVFHIVNPDNGDDVERPVKKVLESGKIVGFTQSVKLISKDGDECLIADSAAPISKFSGDVIGVVLVFRNVTEEIKIQKRIKQNAERYKTVFENTGAATCIIENDRILSMVNSKFSELTGYPISEILNKKKWNDIVVEDDQEKMQYQHELRREDRNAALNNYEFRLITKNRKIKYVFMTIDVIPGTKRSVASIIDITERKQIENNLLKQNLRYFTLLKNLNGMVYHCKNDGKWTMTFVSQGSVGVTGYSPEEFIDEDISFNDIILPKYRRYLWDTWQIKLENREPLEEEYEILTSSGEIKWVWERGRGVFNEDGTLKHLEGFVTDITERKKAKDKLIKTNVELVKAKEKAEESNLLKTAFLQNVSHEIRTPMNGILGFADLLRDPQVTEEEQEEYIDVIERSGNRMLNTINDIMDISKIESGQIDLIFEDVNVEDLIKELSSFFKPEIDENGLKFIICKTTFIQGLVIKTDYEKLYAALANLLKNAIKYTNEGFIEFGCTLKDNIIEFYVKDTGIGIPVDRQIAIFDRFVQADIGERKAYEGSGLGLSIAKAYIDMLGGSLWVKSGENVGSQFFISLSIEGNQ